MKILLASIVLTAGCMFSQVSVGIRIGPPPPVRVVRNFPPSPGPGYIRVDGYWYAEGGKYHWHNGYWTRPPYEGAHWIAPHHDGHQYYAGYWDGPHGHIDHDHHWDHYRDRDYDHYVH